jgi:hypothetical protein
MMPLTLNIPSPIWQEWLAKRMGESNEGHCTIESKLQNWGFTYGGKLGNPKDRDGQVYGRE